MVAADTHLTKRFDDALALASDLHRTHWRKRSEGSEEPETPYMAHLLAVTAIVLEHGGSEDEAIAALLHDAVEDQGGKPTLEKIRGEFGDTVAEIVCGCTDTLYDPKPSWGPRKKQYIERLAKESCSVRLVAAADKLHNVRSVLADYLALGQKKETLWERFTGRRQGTLWFYRAVTTALQCADRSGEDRLDALVRELDRSVGDLEWAANGGTAILEFPGPD